MVSRESGEDERIIPKPFHMAMVERKKKNLRSSALPDLIRRNRSHSCVRSERVWVLPPREAGFSRKAVLK